MTSQESFALLYLRIRLPEHQNTKVLVHVAVIIRKATVGSDKKLLTGVLVSHILRIDTT